MTGRNLLSHSNLRTMVHYLFLAGEVFLFDLVAGVVFKIFGQNRLVQVFGDIHHLFILLTNSKVGKVNQSQNGTPRLFITLPIFTESFGFLDFDPQFMYLVI